EADFSKFERELAELVALRREEAAALAPGGSPYDAMLDRFEPGATEAALVPLFDSLGAALTPLLERVRDRGLEVDESPVLGDFDPEGQRRLGVHAATAFGFDFERGRLDATAHPFCVALTRSDVRLTWRWQRDDLRPALFGILHEAGHGLYEQGLPREWWRQPLGDPGSLGIHESQSRLWENHVGRSEGFWRWLWPTFTDAFPEHAAGTDPAAMWAALHTARPSLIRVEADEATYNQHVIVRFELERRLFRGDLQVPELPEAWDTLYREVLGLSAPDAADGVLQDIHWSQGMFGYFPTYTLGSMISAQLFAAAERDLGPQEDAFEAGEFSPLLAWLRDRIHRHGGRFPAAELVQTATGRPLSADDLLRHLTSNLERAYDL
ncbi:MAG: carboxypeptidase M32, partial [Acidobacteriota bacterium]